MSRILVVEDETHLAQGLRFNLEAEGHAVHLIEKGEDALDLLLKKKEPFDIVVLDVMLPGKNGFTVAQELRLARNYVPVLMLTARGRPEDVLQGFEAGADDYLPKPFELSILLARITSLLRRTEWSRRALGSADPPQAPDSFSFDGKVVDFRNLQLRAGKTVFHLTLMESELLRYLIQNKGHPVSRKAILEHVWNLREDTDTRAIDNFIVRLRRYIEDDPTHPRHLLTVRGVGYRFLSSPPAPDPQRK
jgi:DNA-binding response OmpR family regulator